MRFLEITDDPRRIQESHISNYEEWGPPLSLDHYLEREERLHEIHVRNELSHRTFAMIDEDNDVVVAACEVLTRPLYQGGGRYSSDHCFASVFVKKEYRAHGLGKELMAEAAALFTENDDQMSLWSDVGDYYTRVGFNFPPAFEEEPHWGKIIVVTKATKGPVECEKLDLTRTNTQVLPEHVGMLTRHADSLYYECNGDIKIVVVVPHHGLYEQLQFRAVYAAQKLGLSPPTKFSARTVDGHGWISWTYMFANKKLLILGLFGSANELAILLSAAMEEAAKYGIVVELYESSTTQTFGHAEAASLRAQGLKFEIKERTSSLPMNSGSSIWVCPGGYAWY